MIKLDGSPITWLEVVLRNFLRPIDTSGPFALVGISSIFFHPLRQRPGDIIGQTVVIRERPVDWELLSKSLGDEDDFLHSRVRLSPEEWELLHRYLQRAEQMSPIVRQQTARAVREALERTVNHQITFKNQDRILRPGYDDY